MESTERLTAIHYMIGEAKFCLDYSLTAPTEDKEKFWSLGMAVLENMSEQLSEICRVLKAIKME
jgi:hypothetical protein